MVVSVQDVSKAGYIINGVARIPQTPLKLRNTTISTRTAVLCSGDVLELPEVNMSAHFLPALPYGSYRVIADI